MSRLFTTAHRAKHALPDTDPNFHGAHCETIYMQGMALLSEFHMLQWLISAKRRCLSWEKRKDLRDRKRLKRMGGLIVIAKSDNRSIEELVARIKVVSRDLRIARLQYMMHHSAKHSDKYPSANFGALYAQQELAKLVTKPV